MQLESHRGVAFALILGAVIAGAACGGGSSLNSSPTPDPVGAVSEEEFASIPVPSFEMLADAYGRTLRDDPTALHLDEPKFSRKLFDTVKSLGPAASDHDTDSGTTLLSLSPEEWRLAIMEPVGTYQTYLAKHTVENVIDDIYGSEGRQRNDKVDAFRIAYWNTLSVQRLKGIVLDVEKAASIAKRVTAAHAKLGQSAREIDMDVNNGAVGRRAMLENLTASDPELKTIISTTPAEHLPPTTPILQLDHRTIYFDGRTGIDGPWHGTLTNADSGDETPWSATLYVNQWNNYVRGEMHLYRGDQAALRRFTGEIVDGRLEITFLYPYRLDLGGQQACGGMTASLHSRLNVMNGPWTATTCPIGGQINLERGAFRPIRPSRALQANSGCPCSE